MLWSSHILAAHNSAARLEKRGGGEEGNKRGSRESGEVRGITWRNGRRIKRRGLEMLHAETEETKEETKWQ